MNKKPKVFLLAILISMFYGALNAQKDLNYYSFGIGFDIAYRSPYANNNWMPGIASDIKLSVSKRMGFIEPELYVRKTIFNFTDKIEHHDAKTMEIGINSMYHFKNEHHVLKAGIGSNCVSYQQYDYDTKNGWSERQKRGKKYRFVYQLSYQFIFRKDKMFSPAIRVSYHNIRKFQIGMDVYFKMKPKTS